MKIRNRKKIFYGLLSVALAVVLLLTGVSALFTGVMSSGTNGTAGTVLIDNLNLRIKDVPLEASGTGAWGKSISNWNPGDANMIEWDVVNLGNKSVRTRNTLFLYWDEEDDLRELNILYLYPSDMSDEEIMADIQSGNPSKAILLGSDLIRIVNPDDETRYGYVWTLEGNTLDGIGHGAETGDASDSENPTTQHLSYKLVFSPDAPSMYMGKRMLLEVLTEAMQYRNSSGWEIAATDIIGAGMPVVPENGRKDDDLDSTAEMEKYPYFASVSHGAQVPDSYDIGGLPESYADLNWPDGDYELMGTPRVNMGRYNSRVDIKLDILTNPNMDVSFDSEFVNNTPNIWEIGNFRQYMYDKTNEINWIIITNGGDMYYPGDSGVIELAPGESVILRGYTKDLKYIPSAFWYVGADSKYRAVFDCWEQGSQAETLFTPYADAAIQYKMPLTTGTGTMGLSVVDEYDNSLEDAVFMLEDQYGGTVKFAVKNGKLLCDEYGTIGDIEVNSQRITLGLLPVGTYKLYQLSAPNGYRPMEEAFMEVVIEQYVINNIVVTNYSDEYVPQLINLRTFFINGATPEYIDAYYEIYRLDDSGGSPTATLLKMNKKANGTYGESNAAGKVTQIRTAGEDYTRILLPDGEYLFKSTFVGEGCLADDFIITVTGDEITKDVAAFYIKDVIMLSGPYALTSSDDLIDLNTGNDTYGQVVIHDVDPDKIFIGAIYAVVDKSGDLWTWGSNTYGKLGDGTTTNRTAPYNVSANSDLGAGIISVTGTGANTLVIKSDGSLWSWGKFVGDGTNNDRYTPYQVMTSGADKVYCFNSGNRFTSTFVKKTDGSLWGWGANSQGQLGNGTTDTELSPIQIMANGVDDVYVNLNGAFCSMMVKKTDGSLWSWGSNALGMVGDGTKTDRLTPYNLSANSALGAAEEFYRNQAFCYARKSDGSLWIWGSNAFGQIGDGTTNDRLTPYQVMTGGVEEFYNDVSLLSSFSVFVKKSDGSLWVWGNNAYGQVGDGTTTDRLSPYNVSANTSLGTGIEKAFISYDTVHVEKSDGSLWAWGRNDYGSVGDGTTTDRVTPFRIMSGGVEENFLELEKLNQSRYIKKSDGSLWGWGRNDYGQIGDGTAAHRTDPYQIMSYFEKFFYNGMIGGVIKPDRSVWMWGRDLSGVGNLLVPTRIPDDVFVTRIELPS